jgi:hypothetical protein
VRRQVELPEQLQHFLRRPGQHGPITAHRDRSLQQLWSSFEGGEHGLIFFKWQLTRPGLLHPDHIARPKAGLVEQLS